MKVLVIEACMVDFNDDRGGQAVTVGSLIDVPKETAHALCDMGRTLYTDEKDDPRKGVKRIASAEMVKAAAKAAKAKDPAAGGGEGA